MMLGFRQQKGGGFRCTCKCCNSGGGGNTAASASAAARARRCSNIVVVRTDRQTGNAKARRSARCRRTAIEMASNSSRTSDFKQNGVSRFAPSFFDVVAPNLTSSELSYDASV